MSGPHSPNWHFFVSAAVDGSGPDADEGNYLRSTSLPLRSV